MRSVRAPRVGRQRGRAFQECGGGGQAAAGLRPPGGSFQFGGDLLVRPGRSFGQVPGPPVRVSVRVGDCSERLVRPAPRADRGRIIGSRPDRGCRNAPAAARTQAALSPGLARVRADPQLPGRLSHQRLIAGRVGRRHQQQHLGVCGRARTRARYRSSSRPPNRSGQPSGFPRQLQGSAFRPPPPAPAGSPLPRPRSAGTPARPPGRAPPPPASSPATCSGSPLSVSSGSPASAAARSSPSRTVNKTPTWSAYRRRAANPSTSTDT